MVVQEKVRGGKKKYHRVHINVLWLAVLEPEKLKARASCDAKRHRPCDSAIGVNVSFHSAPYTIYFHNA